MIQLTEEFFAKLKNDKRYKKLSYEYQKLLEDYAGYMRLEQLSCKTIQRGFYMIGKFLAFLENIGVYKIGAVATDIINTFLLSMSRSASRFSKPISVSYLTDYFIHVKRLFKFLREEERILVNPAERINLPKKEDVLPRSVLTEEEISKLLEQPDIKTLSGIRDRAILEILYGSGLRNYEVRKLRIEDIDLENGLINIKESKGAKDRIVPVGKNAVMWIERYLNLRSGLRPDIRELFISDIFNRPISESCICAIIKKYVIKAGILRRVTPHTFRHTYATHLLKQGAPLRHIQALLGHSSIDSTQIYTHVAIPDIKGTHSLFHPRDKLDPLVTQGNLGNSQFSRKIEPRKGGKKHGRKRI